MVYQAARQQSMSFGIGASIGFCWGALVVSEPTASVEGFCTPRFEPLRQLFRELIESGQDLGASLAVTVDGEFALDLWGGWADEARTRRWQRDTITNVFSTTKTMIALTALVLVERGQLDLDAPVARYWHEFAAAGKAGVLVRHILSHTSGLSGWDQPLALEDLYDWDKCTSLLAAQKPWWTPGTASGYHPQTIGFLVGEVVRRITGRRFGRFFAEEIAGPLGADFHIGLARSEFARVSNVVPWPVTHDVTGGADTSSVSYKTNSNAGLKDLRDVWSDAWRQADLPAANGHGNARSVARLQSVVANGGAVGGVRLLSPRTIARIFEVQADGRDLVIGAPMKMGIGYGLPQRETLPFIPDRRICLWGGAGGSMVIIDVDRRMTLAYIMNKMVPELVCPNITALATCFYGIIGG
jgi:CubicO group peptidase (beta-lactamase class C family)